MAFGAPVVTWVPGATGARVPYAKSVGGTLLANVGAPDPTGAAPDSGVYTSGTPTANQEQLPVGFGRGAGNWVAGDEFRIGASINHNTPVPGVELYYVAAVVAGEMVITIHNRSAVPTATIEVQFDYVS